MTCWGRGVSNASELERLREAIVRDLATSLHANAARFQILDIKRGSIIVTIVIVPDPLAQVYVSVYVSVYARCVGSHLCRNACYIRRSALYIRRSGCYIANRPKRLLCM